jgi:hypothetical protein
MGLMFFAEVERKELFKPFKADAWSCGKLLSVLSMFMVSQRAAMGTELQSYASNLMHEDPERRPALTAFPWNNEGSPSMISCSSSALNLQHKNQDGGLLSVGR